MKYRFRLDDIGKYSQRLKYKDINWKFERSAMGKIIPRDEARAKRLQKAAYITRMEELKNAADWAETPIFYMYERHGRWVHQDTTIYSDVECKQLYSLFKSMRGNEVNAADIVAEQEKLIAEHEVKTFRTCEVLMKQLGQLLFWENLKAKYARRTTGLDDLSKVMARNLKMYALIDQVMKIYDLINKIEVS